MSAQSSIHTFRLLHQNMLLGSDAHSKYMLMPSLLLEMRAHVDTC